MLRFLVVLSLIAAIAIGALGFVRGDLAFLAPMVVFPSVIGFADVSGSLKSIASSLFQHTP